MKYEQYNPHTGVGIEVPAEPTEFSVLISPTTEFIKKGWGKRVKALGGSYTTKPRKRGYRKIVLKNEPQQRVLTEMLAKEFCVGSAVPMGVTKCGDTSLQYLHTQFDVGIHDPVSQLCDVWQAELERAAENCIASIRRMPGKKKLQGERIKLAEQNVDDKRRTVLRLARAISRAQRELEDAEKSLKEIQ